LSGYNIKEAIPTKQSRQYMYGYGSTSEKEIEECWHGFPVFIATLCSRFSYITAGKRPEKEKI